MSERKSPLVWLPEWGIERRFIECSSQGERYRVECWVRYFRLGALTMEWWREAPPRIVAMPPTPVEEAV